MKESSAAALHANQQPDDPGDPASLFTVPLAREQCQQIYATALRRYASASSGLPGYCGHSAEWVREQIQRSGPEICLLHPQAVDQVFQGVTLAVYQTIKGLYCSRVARSIPMVIRMLQAMAFHQQVPCLTSEAIWAICLSLETLRREKTAVTVRRDAGCWWVGSLILPWSEAPGQMPCVVGVIEKTHSTVLAVQTGPSARRAQFQRQVLYEALCTLRRPDAKGAAGLCWHLPTHLLWEGASSQETWWKRWSDEMGIVGEATFSTFGLLEELRALWGEVRKTHVDTPDRWGILFESALNSVYGTSPLRTFEEQEQRYSHFRGYMTDPAGLFPALRMLLPTFPGVITVPGEVWCQGLHYAHDLLSSWPNAPVVVRPSAWAEATAWIYLEGEVLCQATARELMRRDGSAFPHPVRR